MSKLRNGAAPQPWLPAQVEHSLNDLAIRLAGGSLVAFAVTSWLSLLSWQTRDPAMPYATKAAARNLLGTFGAGVSDMMVQTLGIAVVFALLCPMVWGMELLANVRWIPRFRIKLVSFLVALLCLAAVASGLPPVPGWPLPGGSGGMVGDLVFNLYMSTATRWGLDRTGLLVLALPAIAGLACLTAAVGLKVRQLFAFRSASAPPDRLDTGVAPTENSPPPSDVAATASAASASTTSVSAKTSKVPAVTTYPVPTIGGAAEAFDESHDLNSEEEFEANQMARAFAERFAPGVAADKGEDRRRFVPALKATIARSRQPAGWRKPSLNLLRRGRDGSTPATTDVEAGATQLLEVLAAFGVKGEIKEARSGPVVTRYELEPVRGTKISRVIGLSEDFARELGAHAVRVSVTPGRTTIGIEVPNDSRDSVMLRDILESDAFCANPAELPLALGKGIGGEPIVLDLARMPHLLIAGTTGSGKSVGLNSMLLSLLFRHDPADLRLLLIDPKMLEMAQYDRIPHLLNPVITDATEAAQALEWAVVEMDERYKRMAMHGTRNIEAYNARVKSAVAKGQTLSRTVQTGFDARSGRAIYEQQPLEAGSLPYIVVVIDELADLMLTAGKRIETSLQRLAQKARAAGIHLVMATQRPSVDVVTGTIKANFPSRISFRVASKIDSRTILNEAGAEQLLGHGDMLLTAGSGQHLRVHGTYVADEEIERVVEALREQGEPRYVDLFAGPQQVVAPSRATAKLADAKAQKEAARVEEDFAAAIDILIADKKASAGHLHRRLGMSMEAAEAAIARMEREGIVSAPNMFGRRSLLVERSVETAPVRRRTAA